MKHFLIKLGQYNKYSVSALDTDSLFFHHQDISSHSDEYIQHVSSS